MDDSSLTQAISTLRKLLQDSTKSPLYIKTIPKRGYQFIASVENYIVEPDTIDLSMGKNVQKDPELSAEVINTLKTEIQGRNIEPTASISSVDNALENDTQEEDVNQTLTSPVQEPMGKQNHIPKKQSSVTIKNIIIIIALLLPVLVYLFTDVQKSILIKVTDIKGIPVYTIQNHPSIPSWLPRLKVCTTHYLNNNSSQAPHKIIISPGLNHNLMINFIHIPGIKVEDNILTLLTSEGNIDNLCQ